MMTLTGIKLQSHMSDQHFGEFGASEDQAFLRNFDYHPESSDILNDLCRVDSNLIEIEPEETNKQEMEQEQPHPNQNQNHGKNKGCSKEKKKIFYRDKMAELLKPGEYIKQEYNYVAYTQYEQNKAPITKEEQLKRNRESAKNSRQRKKEYVVILQERIQQNRKTIEELSQKLEQVTMQRDRLKEYNHQQIKTFLKSKAQAYEQLHAVVASEHTSSQTMKKQIDDMLNRFGTSGTERLAVTNYYMNQMIQVMISDIHRYFMNSSAFNQGFTASNPPKNIDNEVIRILGVDIPSINQIMMRYRQRFNKQASTFKNLTQQLYRMFKSVQNQGKVIELVFADMINQLDLRRVGELILWFQENKFCREVKRIRKEWTDQLKTGQEQLEIIRKQTKQ